MLTGPVEVADGIFDHGVTAVLGIEKHLVARAIGAGSDRGAVVVFRPARFPGPSSEPDVRLATHPALHERRCAMRPCSSPCSTAWGYWFPGSGIG